MNKIRKYQNILNVHSHSLELEFIHHLLQLPHIGYILRFLRKCPGDFFHREQFPIMEYLEILFLEIRCVGCLDHHGRLQRCFWISDRLEWEINSFSTLGMWVSDSQNVFLISTFKPHSKFTFVFASHLLC